MADRGRVNLIGCRFVAHRVISLRCGIYSLSGHSGICRSVADVEALSLRHLYVVHQL
jgi:hypothetical protein